MDLADLKRFVRFGDDDARHLVAFRSIAAPELERVARELDDRISDHEGELAAVTLPISTEQRRRHVVVWLERLLGGVYDDAYRDRALAIGRAQASVGLPPRFASAAMSTIHSLLAALAPNGEVLAALDRILAIEQAIMTEGYLAELRVLLVRQARADAASTLATGFAHELRNPLNGAQLQLAWVARELARAGAGAEVRDAVSVVDGELKRIGRLTTDFLDFVRPKPYALVPTDLRAVGEQAAARVGRRAGGPIVRVELPPAAVWVTGDQAALVQALVNVVENAVEAAAAAVVVRVEGRPRTALVDVEDDGPGLAALDAPIFDAFYTTKAGGTGLGLSVAHRVITDHGGTVVVESKPGKTRFRLTLPGASAPDDGGTR